VAEAEQLGVNAVVGVDVDYESIQIGQGRQHADGQRPRDRSQVVAVTGACWS
jgi:uncharacterized protein YbjQ (UPF0145 family)